MAESYDLCVHEAGIAKTVDTVKPMVAVAMAGFDMMVEAAAQMNQAGRSQAIFDSRMARDLERINEGTSRIMGHRVEVDSQLKALEALGCPDGKAACAETCQKLGAMARLKDLLDNPPRLNPEGGKA